MSDPFFYRLIIFGRPACGCLAFSNPILKLEYSAHITYIFPSSHDMNLVWNQEFLTATCSLKNLVPNDILIEKIYMIDGDFKFERIDYKPDWRTLVERYTYQDENLGTHLNRALLDDLGEK